jgi:hypothetical protein
VHPLTTAGLGLIAGLHAALYGAWKDSPHEGFRPTRFVRELVIATTIGAAVSAFAERATPFLVLLSAFALSRIITEFYKLFLRRERQDDYRIPTQVHWLRHVVSRPWLRVVMGVGWLGAIYGLYALLRLLPDDASPQLVAPLAGILFGSCLAVGGAYKDGFIEGFYWHKFFKSPISAAIGGLLVSVHTTQLEFLVLGTIALERIINEFVHKLLRPGYVPGKFRSRVPTFPEWMPRRKWFFAPYMVTWVVILVLWVWPLWSQ